MADLSETVAYLTEQLIQRDAHIVQLTLELAKCSTANAAAQTEIKTLNSLIDRASVAAPPAAPPGYLGAPGLVDSSPPETVPANDDDVPF